MEGIEDVHSRAEEVGLDYRAGGATCWSVGVCTLVSFYRNLQGYFAFRALGKREREVKDGRERHRLHGQRACRRCA